MNVLFRYIIAAGALTLIDPTFASATDVEQTKSFKLAMGPTSAAQKNQGMTEKSAGAEIKPHRHAKHRRRHHIG